jgi:hypothetical protein
MIDVYWSSKNINPLLLEEPKSVLKDLKSSNFLYGEETKTYYRCPGYTNFFKNMFVVKSPTDFELTYNNDDPENIRIDVDKPQKFFDDNIHIHKYSKDQQMVHVVWEKFFFSEQQLNLTITPAFFHHNGLSNHYLAAGKMDISKWFRPLYLNVILDEKKLKIKKGDALFYLKFETDENINFKHFELNDKIECFSNDCVTLKEGVSNLNFKSIYNMFAKRNYNKKIMKEIKKNLTGDFK